MGQPSRNGEVDGQGRSLRGHMEERGSPFARRMGALRSDFFQEASEEDLRVLCRQLLDRAKGGDWIAATLVLFWLVGKPGDPVTFQEAAGELARMMQTTQGRGSPRRSAHASRDRLDSVETWEDLEDYGRPI